MKIVVDVNVWISALLWQGTPRQILLLASNRQINICASQEIHTELEVTLDRPKFAAKIQSLNLTKENLLSTAKNLSEICPTTPILATELRDPKDRIILSAAIAANAEVIVTGDRDLLVLESFNNILILTPREFLNRF